MSTSSSSNSSCPRTKRQRTGESYHASSTSSTSTESCLPSTLPRKNKKKGASCPTALIRNILKSEVPEASGEQPSAFSAKSATYESLFQWAYPFKRSSQVNVNAWDQVKNVFKLHHFRTEEHGGKHGTYMRKCFINFNCITYIRKCSHRAIQMDVIGTTPISKQLGSKYGRPTIQ